MPRRYFKKKTTRGKLGNIPRKSSYNAKVDDRHSAMSLWLSLHQQKRNVKINPKSRYVHITKKALQILFKIIAAETKTRPNLSIG